MSGTIFNASDVIKKRDPKEDLPKYMGSIVLLCYKIFSKEEVTKSLKSLLVQILRLVIRKTASKVEVIWISFWHHLRVMSQSQYSL